jgi:uncharacterized protein
MEMHESATLDIPVSKVWSALNNPNVLKLSVPGAEDIQVIDQDNYVAKATMKVGFISSRFNNIQVKKLKAIENELLVFELVGEDQNKIGSFKQNLEVRMKQAGTTDEPKTIIEINATVDLKGKFATLGKRIVEWKAKKVIEEFVENLRKLA